MTDITTVPNDIPLGFCYGIAIFVISVAFAAIWFILHGEDQPGGWRMCALCWRKVTGRSTICDVCYEEAMDEYEALPYEVMTVKSFMTQVSMGSYTQEDGTGYFGTRSVQSNEVFDFDKAYVINDFVVHGWTHVYWYNK